jgi:hypothetical protein
MSSIILLRRSPKPGSLHGRRSERATQLVDDEGGESLALDVLGDDEERAVALHDRVEDRQDVLDVADLLVGDQDVGIVEDGLHPLLVRSRSTGAGSPCRTACPR